MGRLIALMVALLAGALLAWHSQTPPAPAGLNAPAQTFSAERAMADVRIMAARPHPLGSTANAAVEAHLLQRMTALGLSPQVRPGVGFDTETGDWGAFAEAGRVRNLVGVLPGRDRSVPALTLMAHYDSAPGSPGSADDAAGVATILETIRALKTGPTPARDVMVVLTDGEEAGLLGADAFFSRDPLAKRVGFLVNLESRGSSGRVQMFQTGARNGQAIELLRRNAVRPSANSLSGAIYKRMPNDTDFSVALRHGVQGLNFAFLGGQFDYHSPTATPGNLDRRTLQDEGDQVLALARAAALASDLPKPAPDRVYGNLFGDLMLSYPTSIGWLVLVAAGALSVLGAVRARKADALPWLEALQGAGAALYLVSATVAVLHLARKATGSGFGWYGQRPLLAHAHLWETAVFLIGAGVALFAAAELARGRRLRAALLAAGAGVASCVLSRGIDVVGLASGTVAAVIALAAYGRPAARPAAWAGVLAVGLLLATALQVVEPLGAQVAAWPLLAASVAAAATGMAADRRIAALAALALFGALTLAWLGGLAHLIFLGLDLPELLALPLLLAALPLWPLAQPAEGAPSSRAVGPTLMILGAVVVLAIRFHAPWTPERPQAATVAYHHDQDENAARYVSQAGESAWTAAVLRADGGAPAERDSWVFGATVQAAPARLAPQPGPQISLVAAGDGVVVRAIPPAGSRSLWLRIKPPADMQLATVDGAPLGLGLKAGKWNGLRWEGSDAPLELRLKGPASGALDLRYTVVTPGWPGGLKPLPPRPPELMGFGQTDSRVASGTRHLAW